MAEKRSWNKSLDVIKTVAIITVLMTHVSAALVILFPVSSMKHEIYLYLYLPCTSKITFSYALYISLSLANFFCLFSIYPSTKHIDQYLIFFTNIITSIFQIEFRFYL